MNSARITDAEIKCELLWKICRRHGWSTPIAQEDLVNLALDRTEQGRGKRLVTELLDEPYMQYQRGRGYRVANSPDAQAVAAFRLRETCQYTTLQIETTLSRFQQAGGFDAYDCEGVFDDCAQW
ncbi:hypothetical protein GCM10025298_27840 [Natronobiforma cellulositropha]